MSLIFQQISTQGIAQLSYLVGDTSTGRAAVIDPRTDVDVYLQAARSHGLTITHALETHIHADFMSGTGELCAQAVRPRPLRAERAGAEYGFELHGIRDGETFEFGSTVLTARHTPGHTPEHVSYLLSEKEPADSPWGVLTGDLLFVGSAGRPDLLGKGIDDLAEALHGTLYDFYLGLYNHVIIYPGHGAGSACGARSVIHWPACWI